MLIQNCTFNVWPDADDPAYFRRTPCKKTLQYFSEAAARRRRDEAVRRADEDMQAVLEAVANAYPAARRMQEKILMDKINKHMEEVANAGDEGPLQDITLEFLTRDVHEEEAPEDE